MNSISFHTKTPRRKTDSILFPAWNGFRALSMLAALVVVCAAARAEDPSVAASLSNNSTTLDDPVELEITVQGARKATPPQIETPGLEFRYSGASSQVQMNNFNVSQSVKYSYIVVPQKTGTFTIPSVTVEVNGKKLATQALKLTVSNSPGSAGGSSPASNSGNANAAQPNAKFAYAEWVVPKNTAYVGETIPAELRLYVDSRVQCQLQQLPNVTGDGFTAQKFNQPQQRPINKDGRDLILVIFKTALTPVKEGKLTLPSVEVHAIAILPSQRSRAPKMRGMPDIFDDPFFAGTFNTPQNVVIRPESFEMEIKPLPAAGRPRNFSGAVGMFTMETKAAPLHVKTGDPVTITATISGVGSFDRMSAPAVGDSPDWHVYPPSAKFKADDDIGISGIKTFEAAAIAKKPGAVLPPVEFSFFNSHTERYETLTGDRIEIVVEGAPPSATATPALVAVAPNATPAAPTPGPKPSDIQYIQLDPGAWNASFEPVWQTRSFWLVQLAPLTALLALGGWKWSRSRGNNAAHRRAAALQREKAAAWTVIRREATPAHEFYQAAIRVVQLETALSQPGSPREPSTVDAEAACESRRIDFDTAEGIRRLFAAHDQLRYAGVGNGGSAEPVYPDLRQQTVRTLEQFEKSHA